MSTANKLTYLNVTKQKLKQAINNLGGEITDDTTFRQYANQLQNVYDNLPKTSYAEGTEITLSNTLKGKLDFENGVVGIGQTEQDSTQGYNLIDINSGDIVTVTFGVDRSINGNEITLNGSRNDGETSIGRIIIDNITEFNSLVSGRTYKLTLNDTSGTYTGKIGLAFLGGSPLHQLDFIETNSLSATKTLSFSDEVTKIWLIFNGNFSATNFKFKLMLQEGSTAHDYEQYTGGQASPNPSYDQEIKSVTGNQDVVVSGKNVFDDTNYKNQDVPSSGGFYFNNVSFTISAGTYRYGVFVDNQLVITPAISALSFKSGGTTVNEVNNPTQDFTITTEQASQIDKISLYFNGTFISTYSGKKITGVMIYQGTDTNYEPYITPTSYQLSLGEYEFNGIGNYKDELVYDVDNDKVYKNEKIKKVVYNGTENWSRSGGTTETVFVGALSISGVVDHNGLSNYFTHSNYTNANTFDVYNNGNNLALRFDINQISDVASLKTWLSTHNTEVYYQKATPTLTELTDPTLKDQVKALYNAHSNNGTTIITSNGNLPMIIKVRALKGE